MYRNSKLGVNRRRVLLLVVTATAMVGIGSPVRAASDSESHGRIVFSLLLPDGGASVFIVNPDGSHVRPVPLLYPAEDFAAPIWSPDGTRLLISHLLRFDSVGELLPFRPAIVRPDGSHFTLLEMPDAPFDMDCTAWLPSGTRILCGFGGDSPGIFSVSASDGGHRVRLTTTPPDQRGDLPGDVSADGTRFVFVRFQSSTNPERAALFTERLDGTGLRQITPYGLPQAHELADARWSPNGREILFSTADGKLATVHPDGSGLSMINLRVPGDYFTSAPGWSPDGSRIVFGMSAGGPEDIYTSNRDGTNLIQVTDTPDFEPFADWGNGTGHSQ